MDEKWKNERQKGWAPFAKIDEPQEIEAYFIFVPFCSDCKKNGGSDRFGHFFAFAEHVPLRAEPPQ